MQKRQQSQETDFASGFLKDLGITMTGDIILQTRGLGKKYGERWAVRGLDLSVRRGEIFGFLGPNGAGKSTTIRMILSLVTPTEGDVELFGVPLRRSRGLALARVGGLVERADFYLHLSGRRNLCIIGDLIGGAENADIEGVLETVGLTARAGDRVKSYSQGMKQRLGLAATLLGSPELLVLDEPTSGLDPLGIKEVRDLIIRLSRERNIAVFLSSHLLAEIEQLATSMAIINRGELIVQGSVPELLRSENMPVRLSVTPVDRALTVLGRLSYASVEDHHEDLLFVRISPERVPEMNVELVHAGVAVHALIPQRTLEEYFLTLTEGASEIR
jgi:ABC-type multidrug transport system ATPase subunit